MSFIFLSNVISLIYICIFYTAVSTQEEGEEEKDKFMQLALDYMSEESSESEGEAMVVHKPAWRSRGNIVTCFATSYHFEQCIVLCSISFTQIKIAIT